MTDHADSGNPADRPQAIEELDNLHIGPPPIRAVIDAGQTVKRRRRAVLASIAAVAVLITGVSVAAAGTDRSRATSDNIADAADVAPLGAPPAGTKWVGMNNVVVAVPSDWPVVDSPCGGSAPAEVINGSDVALVRCAFRRSNTRVTLTPLNSGSEPSTTGSCDKSLPSTCYGTAVFENQKVAVSVLAQGADALGTVEEILDSAIILPDGWATVPFGWGLTLKERAESLEAAGFEVEGLDEPSDEPEVKTTPEAGSPAPVGSTITINPAGDEVPSDLTVTVEPAMQDGDLGTGLPEGAARWSPEDRTLRYVPLTIYNACLVEGNATSNDGLVALTLTPSSSGENTCNDIAMQALITITGLTEAPTELVVIEDGETRTVPVVDAEPSGAPGSPVDLPTNDWREGDRSLLAGISGVLTVDENGCVYLDAPQYRTDNRTYVLWPDGYTATLDDRGNLTLSDPTGATVARDGDNLSMGGGYVPNPGGEPCLPGTASEVASVQSEVTVRN